MTRSRLFWCFLLPFLGVACSSDDPGDGAGSSGGAAGSAGAGLQPAASGGAGAGSGPGGAPAGGAGGMVAASGGGPSVSGGKTSAGGTPTGTGGNVTTGGVTNAGGTSPGTGGASGGAPSAGGSAGAGGAAGAAGATGGAAGAGGATNCTPPAAGSRGMNPLFSDQYTADPAPFVDGCTFYIHCGHDEGSTGFVMREWFVLASTDMVHWTKTVAMKLSEFKWANANAWAGQVVAKGGKYYWYVPVNQSGGGMAIGVATSDSPRGPFKDAIGKALVDDAFEMSNMGFPRPEDTAFTIDPTVFVDDDGQAYLHYGGFGRLVVTKLGSDMTSISGTMKESTPRGFFEAPFLIKRNGKYYEIYAAGQNPATIDYATASSPLGPWTYGGRILEKLPNVAGQDAATSHSGVAQFAGQWYIVYHLSNGPNNGGTYKREVAVDKLTFNSDGSIQKVVPSSGLSF
jgi:hypothetical protein